MSEQFTPAESPNIGIDALRICPTATAAIVQAASASQDQRRRHVERSVREIVTHLFTDDDLTGFGWSAEDIRRLKSR